MTPGPPPFQLRAVVHLRRPWGRPAHDLEQLRAGIAEAPDGVLFQHAVLHPLRAPSADELPPDDFSAWIAGSLQDAETAERLSYVVQAHGGSAAELRAALLEALGSLPEARRRAREAPEHGAFPFLDAISHDYPIGPPCRDADAVVEALLREDAGVWFFQLVEQPWRTAERAPLLGWLVAAGEAALADRLARAAGSGLPPDRARAQFARGWRRSRIARGVARAAARTEDERRSAGREVVQRLFRPQADREEAS